MIVELVSEQVLVTLVSIYKALYALILPGLFFVALALILKRREAIAAAGKARAELSINLWIYILGATLFLPLSMLVMVSLRAFIQWTSPFVLPQGIWDAMPDLAVLFAVIFVGDLIGYCRHRFEHTPLLWPAHAIHHSDTQMSWLTLVRFHPVNGWTTTLIDTLVLTLFGFPAWAMVANDLFRHYYGYFIHADVPWTYGPFGKVFVSPAMHQWHHARDVKGSGSNFATVFAVFDRALGTYHVPGPCTVPLGVREDIGPGVRDQLLSPFRAWSARIAATFSTRGKMPAG